MTKVTFVSVNNGNLDDVISEPLSTFPNHTLAYLRRTIFTVLCTFGIFPYTSVYLNMKHVQAVLTHDSESSLTHREFCRHLLHTDTARLTLTPAPQEYTHASRTRDHTDTTHLTLTPIPQEYTHTHIELKTIQTPYPPLH